MKKILFLIHDLCEGGAEKVLVNLVNNIDANKYQITVMTLFDVGVNKQFLNKNVIYKSCFKYPIPGNSHLLKLFSPRFLYKTLIKDEYDVVISYLEGPAARIIGGAPSSVKTVSWVHSTINNEKELSASFRSFKEAVRCYQNADKVVFVSNSVKDKFTSVCKIHNGIVLYNTNDSKKIIAMSKEEIVDRASFNAEFNWCAVGRMIKLKGFDRMLRIQKRLIDCGYNVHFHALGVGDELDSLKQWCADNDLNNSVTFWGYQTNPYKYVANCDLFVCASHTEGFSTAATEALIVGTPVCTVEVSGMKEMLGENNEYGIVVDNDEDSLCNAIRGLFDEPSLLQHYKNAAIQRSEVFSTSKTVEEFEKMISDLL